MRIAQITLAAMAALTLTTAPLSAQDAPNATMQESVDCMMVTLPFMMVAGVNNPDALEELDGIGAFWADVGDSMAEASEDELKGLDERLAEMMGAFDKLESEADFPSFLAPYQAKFDACEVKRKAMQAG